MKNIWRSVRGAYDRHWLRTYCLWAAAFYSGVDIEGAADHHGSWEWVGWTLLGVSLVLISSVTSRLRKAKCTRLHAQVIDEQRSKAMWS